MGSWGLGGWGLGLPGWSLPTKPGPATSPQPTIPWLSQRGPSRHSCLFRVPRLSQAHMSPSPTHSCCLFSNLGSLLHHGLWTGIPGMCVGGRRQVLPTRLVRTGAGVGRGGAWMVSWSSLGCGEVREGCLEEGTSEPMSRAQPNTELGGQAAFSPESSSVLQEAAASLAGRHLGKERGLGELGGQKEAGASL